MIIIVGNGNGDLSSNPGQGSKAFLIALKPWGNLCVKLFSLQQLEKKSVSFSAET